MPLYGSISFNLLPSLEYGRLSNPSAEDIPSWIKVLDVTDLSLSDKFFEQMPTGIDRIYAPSNELTSLRISFHVICLNFKIQSLNRSFVWLNSLF